MNSSSSCLVLLLLAGFQLISSAEDKYYTDCAPYPFNCGNIGNISYPFLAGDRPEYCGHPDFELSCENNSPEIRIASVAYRVLDIREEDQILTIVEKNFVENECPSPAQGPDMRLVPLDYTIRDALIDFVYDCSSPITNSSLVEVPCLQNNRGLPAYYTTLQPTELSPVFFQKCKVATIMIFIEALSRLLGNQTPLAEVLREGFQVRWRVGTDWCSECSDSGGRCGYNRSNPYESPCFCSDQPQPFACLPVAPAPAPRSPPSGAPHPTQKIIIEMVAGAGGLLVITCIIFIIFRRKHPFSCDGELPSLGNEGTSVALKVEAFLDGHGALAPKRYRYSDLKKITNSFKNKLGQGGYGAVYQGKLADGRPVAVKLLSDSKGNGEEFMNEVACIGRTSHVNVVALLGFCSERSRRALVYEFMPNGSLEKFIYSGEANNPRTLGWEKLYQISVGIARGLEYLHRGCNTRILHFDIKPHNILLDADLCPKISDFGLAKLCPTRDSIISMTGARGTVGYIAPELVCRNIGPVSYKSDVYSFGMMVLEMVGGRKNLNALADKTSEIYFPHWIYKRLAVDDDDLGLSGVVRAEEVVTAKKMLMVGLWCIQTDPEMRPSMSRVLEMMAGSLEEVQMPPKPFLSSPTRH